MIIHILEDDSLYAEFVRRSFLDKPEYEFKLFQSVEDWHARNKTPEIPDVFIVDYHMTGKTGIEFFEEVRDKLPKAVKFIMISALDDGNLVLNFIKIGVRDYVIKDENVIDSLKSILEGDEDAYYLFD